MTWIFQDVKQEVSMALVASSRVAAHISSEDPAFHKSSSPTIQSQMEHQSARLLSAAHRLTKFAVSGTELSPPPQFLDTDSVEEQWGTLVDVFDSLLEKADACLDEFTGAIKRVNPTREEQCKGIAPSLGRQILGKAYRNLNIPKPQLSFLYAPQNLNSEPFRPLLLSKPHALVPLAQCLSPISKEDNRLQYEHPYKAEIEASRYPATTFSKADPIPYEPYDSSYATLVDTLEGVAAMLSELKQTKEIAVDLEHHDEHSYIGLVSLMQISTRKKDWVVDTLKPWRQQLQLLNEVFADPDILKVFHGAFMDIIWLQRDLGIYVVGLFDTFHASRCLGYPRNSLAYLLKTFAGFDAAKQYQTADWRLRPLPKEMFDYARSDTHFLLFVYDNLRNELIDKSDHSESKQCLVDVVQFHSKAESLQRYERPIYDFARGSGSGGWYNLLCRTPAVLNREQFAVFRAIHQWRDGVAREEDESVHMIMPKHVLYNIAREMPVDMPSLLGCSHPITSFLHKRKLELLSIIRNAKSAGATGPDMKHIMEEIDPDLASNLSTTANIASSHITEVNVPSLTYDKGTQSALSLRLANSRFWGKFDPSGKFSDPACRAQSFQLALPLPQLMAEVPQKHLMDSDLRKSNFIPEPSTLGEPGNMLPTVAERSRLFTIREGQSSSKRRLMDGTCEPAIPSDEGNEEDACMSTQWSLNGNEEQAGIARKRHKQNPVNPKQENAVAATSEIAPNFDGSHKQFDYGTAPSVLDGNATTSFEGSKGMNPYAKSMDAPKGAKRSKNEVAGRSHTFKG